MRKKQVEYLDFEIDKLTNSIENVITGDVFETDVTRLVKADLKEVGKRKGWLFNWKRESGQNEKGIYKLTITHSPLIIQGLMSISIQEDHIFINLLESAPFNRGKVKIYKGVAGNLVAFACKISFQHGYDGFVSFQSKTNLVEHYIKTLGAYNVGKQLIVIPKDSSQKLIDKYFN